MYGVPEQGEERKLIICSVKSRMIIKACILEATRGWCSSLVTRTEQFFSFEIFVSSQK